MTERDAKTILKARRPDGADDRDALVVEALALAQDDPELLAWHERQRRLDGAIARKIAEAPVPADLRERILRDHRLNSRFVSRPWFRPLALAAAITILISLGLAFYGRNQQPVNEIAALRQEMSKYLARFPELDLATEQWPDIQRWLRSKPAVTNLSLPNGALKYPGLGCREIRWKDRRVLLVCFAAQGEVVHLLILPGAEMPPDTRQGQIEFASEGKWETAHWRKDGGDYLLMTRGDLSLLKDILAGVFDYASTGQNVLSSGKDGML